MMRATLLCFFFLPVLSVSALGQSPTVVFAKTPPTGTVAAVGGAAASTSDYSAEPIVVERLDSVYEMAADGTGSKISTVVERVQSEASLKQVGVLMIPYAGSTQRVEIAYARVKHPDGTVIETAINQAMEMPSPVTVQAPFYSDLKQIQLPIRSLRVGDTLEWQVKVVMTKAEAPGQFWGEENFLEDCVVLSQSLELRVPKDLYVNVWSGANKPTETTVNGERVYRWVSSQKKPTVGKEADAEKELKKKQLWTAEQELAAKEGKLPAMAWTTFKSWEAVGAWYQGLESDRIVPDAEVKAKVAELTAGKTTEEEKVRAVYGYVATQIRYIGVAFGIGRYQPHRAAEVLENQYGDCKDKHTLLAAMLAALGLHPDAVLIGAGVRFNEAVPSPGSFNHLITTVPVGGQAVWLDSTEEVAPYRALAYVIRDRKALVVPDAGVAKVEMTPATLPFPSTQKMSSVGTLDKEGTSNSHLVLTVRGDDEMAIRAAFRQVSPAQYDQMVQQMSRYMGYAGATSHAEVSRLEETTEPMTIDYDYKREKSGDWDNLKIVPQLAPVELPQVDEKEPPIQAIPLGVPRVNISTSAMKLPDGWGAELPDAIHAKSAYASYDETYRIEKGTVYAERRIEVLTEKVPVAEWKTYKKWVDNWDLTHDRWIQLLSNEKKSSTEEREATGVVAAIAATGEKGSPATAADNSEAAKLIQTAREAGVRNDLTTAKAKLDEAKALNPEQSWLWSMYGFLEFKRGEPSAAIVDYQKELSLHPALTGVYETLMQTQLMVGKRVDAEETLRRWAAVQPEEATPTSQLTNMLLEDKNGAGAVEALEAGIARLPEGRKKDENLQVLLGQAQIMAGSKDKGRAGLVTILKTTQSPEMMNDSAYFLADAGLELELAESGTRTAMGKLDEESKSWTMDEDPQLLNRKRNLIVAVWDTMGWILYREGKLDEAEKYLEAAWLNGQSADIGEHLVEVKTAKGDKNEALMQCELAIATISPVNMMGGKKEPGAAQKKLEAKAEALRKGGAKSSLHDTRDALQKIRFLPLGGANGLNGDVEYRLLLAGGKIERVERIGTSTAEFAGAEERIKKAQLTGFWPVGSEAHLVRSGILNCHSGVCVLVLEP
jgi:tetratricopeptide (TPR) repeat protein